MKSGRRVRCDVCKKIIKTKKFRSVLIYVTSHKEKYVNLGMSDSEKDLDVCNSCIVNLNFRKFTQKEKQI